MTRAKIPQPGTQAGPPYHTCAYVDELGDYVTGDPDADNRPSGEAAAASSVVRSGVSRSEVGAPQTPAETPARYGKSAKR